MQLVFSSAFGQYIGRLVLKSPVILAHYEKPLWNSRDDQISLKVHQNSLLYCFSLVTNEFSVDDQSLTFSKVMSVKSAIFNNLFTTDQKINIAFLRILIDFYSNIRALAMLSRCSLELSKGVFYFSPDTLYFVLYLFCLVLVKHG